MSNFSYGSKTLILLKRNSQLVQVTEFFFSISIQSEKGNVEHWERFPIALSLCPGDPHITGVTVSQPNVICVFGKMLIFILVAHQEDEDDDFEAQDDSV